MAFTATTGNSAQAWRPDLYAFDPQDALADALILNLSTIGGQIEGDEPALRVAFCSDDTAEFVDEGAAISESEPGLNEELVYTRKFAQLVRLSREQYSQAGTAGELARSVSRAMTVKADKAFLAQAAPTSPDVAPAAGLVNWSGIESETVSKSLDSLIDLEAAVRGNGAVPSAWVLAPDCWAALRKLKTATSSNQSLIGAGTDDSEPRLLSIPIVVNAQMPSLTGLLVDKTAVVSAVSQLSVATSSDVYFANDEVAIRALWRTGHAVPRPGRIGKFTVSTT